MLSNCSLFEQKVDLVLFDEKSELELMNDFRSISVARVFGAVKLDMGTSGILESCQYETIYDFMQDPGHTLDIEIRCDILIAIVDAVMLIHSNG
jgi:hypothetical protein